MTTEIIAPEAPGTTYRLMADSELYLEFGINALRSDGYKGLAEQLSSIRSRLRHIQYDHTITISPKSTQDSDQQTLRQDICNFVMEIDGRKIASNFEIDAEPFPGLLLVVETLQQVQFNPSI